jgi:hypothetical protein
MRIHDWTRVAPGIFHDFHHEWITTINRSLNFGRLPPDHYALAELVTDLRPRKRSRIAVSRTSDHGVIAIVEIVSPGNKANRQALDAFVAKVIDSLKMGIHVLIIDLFPPGPHDRQGIHAAIWSEMAYDKFESPGEKPLMVVAYCANTPITAYVEPVAVGDALEDMPLFLEPERYVPVLLAATYEAAWQGVPAYWREQLDS